MKFQKIILFCVPLLLALPFLNRAFFVDDNYFVEIAEWLKENPTLPYHFTTDDAGPQNRGWEENGFVRMVNPLVHHYYLAGLIKLGGAKEWWLRFGCVLLSCFSALFIFDLARRHVDHPVLATLLILVTPAQWLSSYSLLIDPTLAFFFLGGLVFFIRGAETDSAWRLGVSGVFMGLAICTKYPGLLILPVTMAWFWLHKKKCRRPALFFLLWAIALLFLGFYSWETMQLYGRPHILAASGRMVHVFGPIKVLSFIVFFSGVTVIPLLAWATAPAKTKIVGGLLVFIIAVVFTSSIGGFTRSQGFLMGLWTISSVLFVAEFLRLRKEWVFPKDHFLFVWVAGFIGLMLMVMDWVAARYYLIALPAIIFMAVRLVEMQKRPHPHVLFSRVLVLVFIFSGLLATADYHQAEPSRQLGAQLQARGISGGERHFYFGDSFTMSYLKQEGWAPCFPQTVLKKGDVLLAKSVTMPPYWFPWKKVELRPIAEFDFPSRLPLKVMDYHGSAGFYASVWGALPFSFSTGPWERFHVFEVVGGENLES